MRTFVEDRPEATWPSATLPESLHGGPAVPWRAVAWACSGPSSGACVRRLGAPCRNCRVCYSSMGKAKVDGEHAPSLPAGLRRPKARLLSAARFDCSKLDSFEVIGAPRVIQSPLRRHKQRHGARQLGCPWIRSPSFTKFGMPARTTATPLLDLRRRRNRDVQGRQTDHERQGAHPPRHRTRGRPRRTDPLQETLGLPGYSVTMT